MKILARLFTTGFAVLAVTAVSANFAFAHNVTSASATTQDKPRVEIKTNLGSMVIELDPTAAPKTVENFLSYVKSGQYDGTVFHRVIKGFMIQGGGFSADM
ncbi:MAG: peptidylprolyl isomerase, partial [Casimicrobium sp.]